MKNAIDKIIEKTNLNLKGLNVITEAASLEYQLMPLLAARAGANVVALGKDSNYGTFEDIKREIESKAIVIGVEDKIDILHLEDFDRWQWADIITNSGMLRPINKKIVEKLKSTSVIPLLWETWEFRPSEIDIETCQENNILVIGTNEGFDPINMFDYPGMLAIHILNQLRVDYSSDTIALFGGELPGTLIANHLSSLNKSLFWFADDYRKDLTNLVPYKYDKVESMFEANDVKVILFAEHSNPIQLIGSKGLLKPKSLKNDHNSIRIGHLCGNIDLKAIKNNDIFIYPEKVASFGYLSILPNIFGPTPMLKLFSGGLKVGEIAARSRLSGDTLDIAIDKTVKHGVGQDFEGGFYNFNK